MESKDGRKVKLPVQEVRIRYIATASTKPMASRVVLAPGAWPGAESSKPSGLPTNLGLRPGLRRLSLGTIWNFLCEREKKMNCFCWVKKGAILAVIGTTFLGADAAGAQEAKTWREMKSRRRLTKPKTFFGRRRPSTTSSTQRPVPYRHLDDCQAPRPADDLLGATMQPVGRRIAGRSSDIPAGQGLVVEGLRGEGASAQAGLQQNDIYFRSPTSPWGPPMT